VNPPVTVTAALAGLLFGLSLLVAIGAQNTFVLRQGLRRNRVLTVVTICTVSDAVLIAAGVGGASVALEGRHWLLAVVRIVGAAFLFGFAALAARRALRPASVQADPAPAPATSWAAVAATCLAFTWLNPAVYLDTVVVLGSVANTRPGRQWWFAAGAAVGSLLWFVALGFGSRLLTPLFRRPGAWRALDVFVAVVMTATGLRVLLA
jgi:L-lysine exporter family protein LysE/ArgO